MSDEVNIEEGKKENSKTIIMSDLVNQELVSQLIDYGFTKTISEKALYLTGNDSVDKAVDWIEEHQQDPDYFDELVITEDPFIEQGHRKDETVEATMNEADERRQARALLEQIRRQMKNEEVKREEGESKRQEVNNKEAAITQNDKNGRQNNPFIAKPVPIKQTPIDKVQLGIRTIKQVYTEDKYPNVARVCFTTLEMIMRNLIEHPDEKKFKKIKKANSDFAERVGNLKGGIFFLKAIGFEDDGESLVIKRINTELIKSALQLLTESLT